LTFPDASVETMVIKVLEVEVEAQCNLLDMSVSMEPVCQITRYNITEDHNHSTEL